MGSVVRRIRAQVAARAMRRKPLDYRKFRKPPELEPVERDAIAAETADALRRGGEEPDQNRKLGKHFEDVLDTLHSKSTPALVQTTSERETEELDEAALLLALRRKLRGTLRSQQILLSGVEPDGLNGGYLAIAHDEQRRQFEAHFSFGEGMALGADSPVGLVEKIVAAFHEKIVAARNQYYARAGVDA